MLVPATLALHAHEPVLQPPAAKIGFELSTHEPRNPPPLLPQLGEQFAVMAFDHAVENRFFWAVTLIATPDTTASGLRTWTQNRGT